MMPLAFFHFNSFPLPWQFRTTTILRRAYFDNVFVTPWGLYHVFVHARAAYTPVNDGTQMAVI
jgi:hypothetical protein